MRETEPDGAAIPTTYQIRDIDDFEILKYPGVNKVGLKTSALEDAVFSRSLLVVFITNYR